MSKRPDSIPGIIATSLVDIGKGLLDPTPSKAPGDPKETRRVVGTVYANLDHHLEPEVVGRLHQPGTCADHTAWDFHATVWYDKGQWHSYVMQYREHKETLSDPDLMTLIQKVNDKYGNQ